MGETSTIDTFEQTGKETAKYTDVSNVIYIYVKNTKANDGKMSFVIIYGDVHAHMAETKSEKNLIYFHRVNTMK